MLRYFEVLLLRKWHIEQLMWLFDALQKLKATRDTINDWVSLTIHFYEVRILEHDICVDTFNNSFMDIHCDVTWIVLITVIAFVQMIFFT